MEDARRLRADLQSKRGECATSAHAFDTYLDQALMSIRGGRPTLGLLDDAERLAKTFEAATEGLLNFVDFILDQCDAFITAMAEVPPISYFMTNSAEEVKARFKRARDDGNRAEMQAVREEIKLARSRIQEQRHKLTQRQMIYKELMPAREFIEEFRTSNKSLWISVRARIEVMDKLISPPVLAMLILTTLTKPSLRAGVLGCAEEMFNTNMDKHGRRWAVYYCWVDVFWSVGPLLGRLIGRLISAYNIWGQ
jgi:hypothetical protein